jgi:hypothetical protein
VCVVPSGDQHGVDGVVGQRPGVGQQRSNQTGARWRRTARCSRDLTNRTSGRWEVGQKELLVA